MAAGGGDRLEEMFTSPIAENPWTDQDAALRNYLGTSDYWGSRQDNYTPIRAGDQRAAVPDVHPYTGIDLSASSDPGAYRNQTGGYDKGSWERTFYARIKGKSPAERRLLKSQMGIDYLRRTNPTEYNRLVAWGGEPNFSAIANGEKGMWTNLGDNLGGKEFSLLEQLQFMERQGSKLPHPLGVTQQPGYDRFNNLRGPRVGGEGKDINPLDPSIDHGKGGTPQSASAVAPRVFSGPSSAAAPPIFGAPAPGVRTQSSGQSAGATTGRPQEGSDQAAYKITDPRTGEIINSGGGVPGDDNQGPLDWGAWKNQNLTGQERTITDTLQSLMVIPTRRRPTMMIPIPILSIPPMESIPPMVSKGLVFEM